MRPVVLPLPGHEPLASRLALRLGAQSIPVPGADEAPVAVKGSDVVMVGALQQCESELVPLLMTARRARRSGAATVYLVAPRLVLPAGGAGGIREALRRHFDGTVTVAGDEGGVADGPWLVAGAGPALAMELERRVERPCFVAVGDLRPWMEDVAARFRAPLLGAASFATAISRSGCSPERVPALLAESVGHGEALVGLARQLQRSGAPAPLVAVVHADFAPGAAASLQAAGVAAVVSTNTLLHPSNQVDVSEVVADALWRLWSTETEAGQ